MTIQALEIQSDPNHPILTFADLLVKNQRDTLELLLVRAHNESCDIHVWPPSLRNEPDGNYTISVNYDLLPMEGDAPTIMCH